MCRASPLAHSPPSSHGTVEGASGRSKSSAQFTRHTACDRTTPGCLPLRAWRALSGASIYREDRRCSTAATRDAIGCIACTADLVLFDLVITSQLLDRGLVTLCTTAARNAADVRI